MEAGSVGEKGFPCSNIEVVQAFYTVITENSTFLAKVDEYLSDTCIVTLCLS